MYQKIFPEYRRRGGGWRCWRVRREADRSRRPACACRVPPGRRARLLRARRRPAALAAYTAGVSRNVHAPTPTSCMFEGNYEYIAVITVYSTYIMIIIGSLEPFFLFYF